MTKSTLTPPTSVAPLGRLPETRSARSEAARATPGLRRHRLPIAACALGLAAVGMALATPRSVEASSLVFAEIPYVIGGPTASGTLDGVGFSVTLTDAEDPNWPADTGFDEFDLSGAAFNPYAGGTEGVIAYMGASSFTVEFDSPISDLLLYVVVWRTAGTYTFDYGPERSVTLNGGFDNGSLAGNELTGGGDGTFMNGIVSFSGPVDSFTVNMSGTVLPNAMTLATFGASAVPGAGLAGLATVGLAGVARRRRR